MKVCSQCEFIYEDDQGVCDMDGAALIYDAAPRALSQGLAAESRKPASKSRWKSWAASAFTGIVLGAVLVLLFSVLIQPGQGNVAATQEGGLSEVNDGSGPRMLLDLRQPVELTPAMDVSPLPISSPMDSPAAPRPQPQAGLPSAVRERTTKPSSSDSSLRAKVANRTDTAKSRPAERDMARPAESSHHESKVGSLLKKTGRILKKPFKF
jgi:hypothetical protein